ncbi:wax ester/triacylglycerol synthase domain-containing protein [Mycobacterium angelicum]|uniref:diacylglycerol O-acyltransferase n=1 Tax=Mycobacterium angelicum TaxID=470074 RepID=A0A1W9ZF58_MYCAN|nr:wax ester/triacylglycerol synthase domain-containing protein [Mycobacterium angelicum]MCV7199642.1 DUF1298 domain-containing protein [Mycobacterium angelicum]ORA13898.1 diacylglycerol O-acyltransferase [Mycobacterium angelicum]
MALTKLDAVFRRSHDADRHASMAIGAVAIVKGAMPSYDRLKTLLTERIPGPEQHKCDVAQHVHRIALPRPGDDGELFRAIAHALEHPLDTDRSLWECWLIEGLKNNRWAILMKVHPYLSDRVSAAQFLTRLCDDADHRLFANHVAAQPNSSANGAANSWTAALWRAPATLYQAAAQAVSWPLTWTTQINPAMARRRYHTVRVPRADVDAVCRKFGVAANDVALAAITEGFRKVLQRRGEQPRADSLRTLADSLSHLPLEHHDPVTQLRTVHNRLNQPPQQGQRRIDGISSLLPFALCGRVIQALTRLPQQGLVTLATNAPGPRHRLRLLGQSLDQLLPIPPTALQLSTGVAVLSYGNELVFGITADYDAAPDLEQLAAGIQLGMARLVALSQDSVLLFSTDCRKRSARALPDGTHRGSSTRAMRARH